MRREPVPALDSPMTQLVLRTLFTSICAHRWFLSSLWLLLPCTVGLCSNALGKLPSGAEQSAREGEFWTRNHLQSKCAKTLRARFIQGAAEVELAQLWNKICKRESYQLEAVQYDCASTGSGKSLNRLYDGPPNRLLLKESSVRRAVGKYTL
jgi:hypothetical protein